METILERNVRALAARSPEMARRVMSAPSRTDVEFVETGEGALSARVDGRLLASARRPREEALRWAQSADLLGAGAFVVGGFGMGWHVEALAKRLGRWGIVIAFEPDAGLLRAVLERVDHSAWLGSVAIVPDAEDVASLNRGVAGLEALAAIGVSLLAHPAGKERIGEAWDRFGATVTRFVKAIRTTITTTLVQGETTLRNALMNADRYVSEAGIADLAQAAAGKPAIVVSAGPSLARNVDLLARPGVRDRVVIIAVQTVLKTLLARGIRPHYVVALDYHQISTRFYEGLTARDVQGVELVVEPKANAAILEAFPGSIRCAADARLDAVLGSNLSRSMGAIEPGATVAHLAYLLGRHLGCDPVILIGQDLGFTDGQYYASGAAIHEVWAGELNEFRSLEMFEWERIARQRHLLTKVQDHVGRGIYTDEQMHSYLVQFEQLFARDRERGLRTVDATEGGVRKRGTDVMPLAESLERFAGGPAVQLPRAERVVQGLAGAKGAEAWRAERAKALRQRLEEVRRQAQRVGAISRETGKLLEQMRGAAGPRLEGLMRRVERYRDEVLGLEPAFGLVQFVSQAAALNRMKADRELALAPGLDAREKQEKQIARDASNVAWLAEASDRVEGLIRATIEALGGAAKLTSDPVEESRDDVKVVESRRRVCAVIPVDEDRGALGIARPIEAPIAGGLNALELTLARLARAREVDGLVLLSRQPERVRRAIARFEGAERVQIVHVEEPRNETRARAVAGARRWAHWCWRGGVAGLTCHDEVMDPAELLPVMEEFGIDAAAPVGADWCAIDPDLTDACISRHREAPEQMGLVFTQAPPGLAPCVVSRALVKDLAGQSRTGGPLATLGGLLGYTPSRARADAIAKANCVAIEPEMRDLLERFIADSPARCESFREALATLGRGAAGAPTMRIARAVAERLEEAAGPEFVTLELCTGRLTSGDRARWLRGSHEAPERRPLDEDEARDLFKVLGRECPGVAVTLAGAGDPVHHPRWRAVVESALTTPGIAGVHVRTDLLAEPAPVRDLLECGADVVSIDLLANSRQAYAKVAGVDLYERVNQGVNRLVLGWRSLLEAGRGMATPWIVPRLTRCDATLEEVEEFYDHWLSQCAACVVDPLPRAVAGERISPLAVPSRAAARMARGQMTVQCDGAALVGSRQVGNVFGEGLDGVWKRVVRSRRGAKAA